MILGVTGGIGSGKSTVAGFFQKRGAVVADADRIAKKILSDNKLIQKAAKIFGPHILKGNKIDRVKLAETVFTAKKKLKELESITHPVIIKEILKVAGKSRKTVVIDAPLLIESSLHRKCDFVIVVVASKKNALRRCVKKGMPIIEAKRRMAAQMDLSAKKKYADFIIVNNGTIAEAEKKAAVVYDMIEKER